MSGRAFWCSVVLSFFSMSSAIATSQTNQPQQPAARVQPQTIDRTPVAKLTSDQAKSEGDLISQCEAKTRQNHQPAEFYCLYLVDLVLGFKRDRMGPAAPLEDLSMLPQSMARALGKDSGFAQSAVQAAEKSAQTQIPTLQNGRIDKEIGSPPSANGATDLVSKPGASQLLAAAVQSGVLTEGQSGNTITLSGNADQLGRYIFAKQQSTLAYTTNGTPILEHLNLSASLVTNTSGSSSVPTSGSATSTAVPSSSVTVPSNASKLSSITARYEFQNKFNPRNSDFQKRYKDEIRNQANQTLVSQAGTVVAQIAGTPECTQGDRAAIENHWATGAGDLDAAISDFDTFVSACVAAVQSSPEFVSAMTLFQQSLAADVNRYFTNVQHAQGPAPITFEYVYNKPTNQPDSHDFRLIGSQNLGAGIWTLNAAGSIYATVPTGAKYGRFKCFQASAEFDRKFSSSSTNSPTFTIAGYGQWQPNPSVLNVTASEVPSGITLPTGAQTYLTNTSGWLGVVQAKLTVLINGAQIPVSAKWSNQKNLLDGNKRWGGQFGLSYDLTSLKQLFGGGS